jgi:hypothetical protein
MLQVARLHVFHNTSVLSIRAFASNKHIPVIWRTTKINSCKHDIFNFKVDNDRKEAVVKQVNLHGGLNDLLEKHGHCPLETCKQAIERAFALGLIGMHTYKECIDINKKSNNAKHKW